MEQELFEQIESSLSNLSEDIQMKKLDSDLSSGMTPKRRTFEYILKANLRYPTSWTLTKSHDDLVASFRQEISSPDEDSNNSAEIHPMEEDQENQEEGYSKLPKLRPRRQLGLINK